MQEAARVKIISHYCHREDLSTFDPYDLWQTKVGTYVKSKYYKYNLALLPVAGILTIYDLFINNTIRLNYRKKEYPIVRALAALSLMNVYKSNNLEIHKNYAQKHIKWLLENAVKTNRGIGWGLPFTWPANKSLSYNRNTPFSTHTPYAFEAIYRMHQIDPDKKYQESMKAIYNFFENDLKIMDEDEVKMGISYGPMEDRITINAVSYALLMYAYFMQIFPEERSYLISKTIKFYNYIKYYQGSEGEWLYDVSAKSSFIDCFHSCFILQNLIKTKNLIPDVVDDTIIQRGWEYIKLNFFDKPHSLYRRFSKRNKLGITKFDLYDNAEVLHTAILLQDHDVEKKITNSISENFFRDDDIYSALSFRGIKINKNMLRWAVMPLIHVYSLKLINNYVWDTRVS
jgi:hypothetical protein